MYSSIQAGNELLRKHGYRLTPQRHMILSVIQEANEHLSIEDILERVQKCNPAVSLSTIYRNLELLRTLGLIRENRLPGSQPCYEVVDGQAHHHLVCRRCQTTIHLDQELLGDLHKRLQTQYHFYDVTLDLLVEGYCTSCWHTLQQEKSSLEAISPNE